MLLLTDLDKIFNIIQSLMLYSSTIYLANIYNQQHTRGRMSFQEGSTPAAAQARERQAGALGGSWAWASPVPSSKDSQQVPGLYELKALPAEQDATC